MSRVQDCCYALLQWTLLLFLGIAPLCPWVTSVSHAQITLDGSLGPEGALVGPDYTIDAELGQLRGDNLFHSFGEFNVQTGESATFRGPDSVDNVVGRVTGGNASFIDGLLRSEIPDANLYLLNPSGVVFGENATLEVDGSFHVSTADYLRLGQDGRFDAAEPKNSILTAAAPEAFGFLGENIAGITITGSRLEVPEDKTLSVVGGDVHMAGGTLSAASGRINIASVQSAGEVIWEMADQVVDVNVNDFIKLGEVELVEGTLIDTTSDAGGTVLLRGEKVTLDDSGILAQTRGDVDGAQVGIDVHVSGDVVVRRSVMGVGTSGTGRGGELRVTAARVELDGAGDELTPERPSTALSTQTEGNGNAGDLTVTADVVEMRNGAAIGTTTLGAGQGGMLEVQADQILIDRATLSARTEGTGDGGALRIAGRDGEAARQVVLTNDAFLTAETLLTGAEGGTGGAIEIRAEDFRVENGAILSTGTAGAGRAGDMEVTADQILLDRGFLVTLAEVGSTGKAGALTLTGREIEVRHGAALIAGTKGAGRAGDMNVRGMEETAAERVVVTNGSYLETATADAGDAGDMEVTADQILLDRGFLTTVALVESTGNAGTLTLTGREIDIRNDAAIAVANFGEGKAGDINIVADMFISKESTINIRAVSGEGGNIVLPPTNAENLPHLVNLIDSTILTNVSNDPDLDNVRINSMFIILNDSEVSAQAPGAKIKIGNPDAIYLASPESKVVAEGGVQIFAGSVISDISGAFAQLPDIFLNASELLPVPCAEQQGEGNRSSFTVSGRGGLPVEPGRFSLLSLSLENPSQAIMDGGEQSKTRLDP